MGVAPPEGHCAALPTLVGCQSEQLALDGASAGHEVLAATAQLQQSCLGA